GKCSANSITPATPPARRARIARRVGSARAPKVSLRFALTFYRTIRLYNAEPFTGCAPGGQARRGRGAAALAPQTGIHQHRQCMLTETPRLRLRPLADADAPFILELLNDPDFLSNVAITSPGNSASIRILEALGLKFERLVRFSEDGSESRLFVLEDPGVRG